MLNATERAKLDALRATRPDDEIMTVFWVNGEPAEVLWASEGPGDHVQSYWRENMVRL